MTTGDHMKIQMLDLEGAAVVDTTPFVDERGTFARIFCEHELSDLMGGRRIVNVNISKTLKCGVIRGMHFQRPPKAEIKMMRCVRGSIYDVIIDIRRVSPTFLQWYGTELSSENMKMLFVPEGFAHGFQSLEDDSDVMYFNTNFYSPTHESGLNYADPKIGIKWKLNVTSVSDKDKNHPFINDQFNGFVL